MKRSEPGAASQRGFTIVELLVVVSIIILLLSILLPSMREAREAARIAKCTSQLHQMGVALLDYAADQQMQLPPGNATSWRGYGIDATWTSAGGVWPMYQSQGKGQPMGLAFLVMNDYITDARLMYCPSWKHPYHQYDTVDVAGLDGAGGPNMYGGWPAPGHAGPTRFRGISYIYRSTFGCNTADVGLGIPGGMPPNLRTGNGSVSIVSDHWTRRYDDWSLYGHKAGYPTLRLDGGAVMTQDYDNKFMVENNVYWAHGRWGFQENIWQTFFDK